MWVYTRWNTSYVNDNEGEVRHAGATLVVAPHHTEALHYSCLHKSLTLSFVARLIPEADHRARSGGVREMMALNSSLSHSLTLSLSTFNTDSVRKSHDRKDPDTETCDFIDPGGNDL